MWRTTLAGCVWFCMLLMPTGGHADPSRPNVVFFLVDDMGWMDCGVYGSRYYETPHIDRLAERGMRFTDAYSANPLCSPTRASILTGKYPARLGLTSAVGHRPPQAKGAPRYPEKAPSNRRLILPESLHYLSPAEHTLAEALRDAGYRTGHFGKWHLGLTKPYWPEQQGYDIAWHGKPDPGPPAPNGYFSPYSFKAGTITPGPDGEYIVDRLTDEAIRFIEESHRQDKPFFAAVWQYGVHGPWDHKEEYTRQFVGKSDPRGRQGNPVMASMLKSVDESLGRIVTRLDELGLSENTIILFTSDNGGNVHSNQRDDRRKQRIKPGHPLWRSLSSYRKSAGYLPPTNNYPLRAGKGTLYEGGVRVPLIVSWPGQIPAGSVSSEIVSSIDFYPTLLDLLNIQKRTSSFDGISFAAVLRDPSVRLDRETLFNFFPHGGPSKPPGVTVRQGTWKLIRWFETSPQYPAPNELYDLEADLGETTNLARQHPEKVRKLNALIDRFLNDTGALLPKPNPAYQPNALQGWIPKSCETSVVGDVLRVNSTSRRPFLAYARFQERGPLELRVRLRGQAGGEVLAQWRTTEQGTFPKNGQTATGRLQADDWQNVRLRLDEAGQVTHVRLHLPPQETLVEIDWIELWRADESPKRLLQWDFHALSANGKQ